MTLQEITAVPLGARIFHRKTNRIGTVIEVAGIHGGYKHDCPSCDHSIWQMCKAVQWDGMTAALFLVDGNDLQDLSVVDL